MSGEDRAPAPDLSVVVVNYNSSAFLEPFIESVLADAFTVDGRPGRLEVVVVDNASRRDDHRRLESLVRDGVRLLRNPENVGYALANNQGFHVSRGRWHLVSNPDVRVERGCLQALLDAVETIPGCAVSGPLASMDEDGRVLMPPNELPDPYLESLSGLARAYPAVARYNIRRRARFAVPYWKAREPLRLPMLSGGFFLGRRETFLKHGLFDPGYPLYYEDTDLFRRFHERGLELWHVPAARIVHHFSRSALTRMKASLFRNQVGARRYFERHFGSAGLRCHEAALERPRKLARDHLNPFPMHEPAPSPDCPVLELPDLPGTYLEVAGNPQFTLAVGHFPEDPGPCRLPRSFWDQLGPGRYWVRAGHPETHETLAAWRIVKCPRT